MSEIDYKSKYEQSERDKYEMCNLLKKFSNLYLDIEGDGPTASIDRILFEEKGHQLLLSDLFMVHHYLLHSFQIDDSIYEQELDKQYPELAKIFKPKEF